RPQVDALLAETLQRLQVEPSLLCRARELAVEVRGPLQHHVLFDLILDPLKMRLVVVDVAPLELLTNLRQLLPDLDLLKSETNGFREQFRLPLEPSHDAVGGNVRLGTNRLSPAGHASAEVRLLPLEL